MYLVVLNTPHALTSLSFTPSLCLCTYSPKGLADVVEVACGSAFNLALCDDGTVYSWGLGKSFTLLHVSCIRLCVCLLLCLLVCFSVRLYACLLICLSVYWPVRLSACRHFLYDICLSSSLSLPLSLSLSLSLPLSLSLSLSYFLNLSYLSFLLLSWLYTTRHNRGVWGTRPLEEYSSQETCSRERRSGVRLRRHLSSSHNSRCHAKVALFRICCFEALILFLLPFFVLAECA